MKELIKKFIPSFMLSWYHLALSFAGAFLYGFPSRKLVVIGITGTNGKSTTTHFATDILRAAGKKVASISTVRFQIADKAWKNELKMTMPGRFTVQKFLRQAVSEGCTHVVLEVTSEGIQQHRHRFISFDVAVLTNIRPEHLEAHGSFDAYKKAKFQLFRATRSVHIINGDEEVAVDFLRAAAKEKIVYGCTGVVNGVEDITYVRAQNVMSTDVGVSFELNTTTFTVPVAGTFNAHNALAAVCVGMTQGVGLDVAQKALAAFQGVAGRMEIVQEQPFRVVVDYAHTPDALEAVFDSVKPEGKLLCVLGSAGGGRDAWKRPEMGKIASAHCDRIFLTDEDPYDEPPEKIMDDIQKGFGNNTQFERIIDRKEAIAKALRQAQSGDVVTITGKGREPWMCVAGGKKIPWDDAQIAKDALQNK